MRQITRYLLIVHEVIWLLGSAFLLYASQWMIRALLHGDFSINVIMIGVPWIIFFASSIIVIGGFITENPFARKYYIAYGFLRSLYLAYLVYRGVMNETYEISAFFGVIDIVSLYALRVVSNWEKSLEIADDYDAVMAQFDKPPEPPPTYTPQPTPEPVYTPPPPEPVMTPHEWYCTECGKANPDNFKFCGECGKPKP
ncbi:MAG: zinc ribbon domain-containing protein [Candidatus Bathyarchaeota archaeon]|nr:zinc ribbon domain-containing protein [Candidatus Bathyarchaeota archaeon]